MQTSWLFNVHVQMQKRYSYRGIFLYELWERLKTLPLNSSKLLKPFLLGPIQFF